MLLTLFTSVLALASVTQAATCSAKALKAAGQPASLKGVKIQEIIAESLTEWSDDPGAMPRALPLLPVKRTPLNFCNVTIIYTHPGVDDRVRISIWLPLNEMTGMAASWDKAAGVEGALAPAVAMGYAGANTDAGHSNDGDLFRTALDSTWWGLKSHGNVHHELLHMLGYRSLEELTLLAKHITEHYYGKKIQYSYWNGCSTGGRQGMILAQRYPSLYQGILSAAPSFNWVTFLVTEFYPQVVMKKLNYYPAPCELDAITAAAIAACDELDGVKDGIISAPGLCKFDPKTVVGQKYTCGLDSERKITKEAAEIVSVAWSGPSHPESGDSIWFGTTHDASLPGIDPFFGGLATTTCNEESKDCKGRPFPISADWIRTWILKDPEYDLSTIDEEQFFDELLVRSYQEYHSAIDSADPDLRRFRKAGGKILSWHGLQDQLIPPNGTSSYHDRVEAIVGPGINDFYRHFEAPGVAHCLGGPGAYPITAFLDLVNWVEKGDAPGALVASNLPFPGQDESTFTPFGRKLCPWPKVASFQGGSENNSDSFECKDHFELSKAKAQAKDEL
ncbi:Putative tannase/feruloyl esterase, alpha/Beta hydrolase [Septoria linicola]|uniref:Carboxylic ester hydrolase n=1 Tax=Septoria linicola TaxID=215465 RepID=A0A9Q9EQA9_9PEZI|nr:Putative tannase/feruloyl esterase, alpha/Beta hydrolase [Septoria linicola]